MTRPSTLTIPLVTIAMMACISERQRTAMDSTDTSAPDADGDTATTPDTAAPDSGVPDGADDSAGSEDGSDGADWEAAQPDCTTDEDCQDHIASACHAWICNRGWCAETPVLGGTCDDGNRCTINDFCDQGGCAGGRELSCDMLSPDCWQSAGDVCEPASGCPGTAAPADSSCYDGFGLEGGTCFQGWVVPDDRCDGAGLCRDTSGLVPTTIHPLAGSWHMVLSNAPNHNEHHTLRADLELGVNGELDVEDVQSSNLLWVQSLTADGVEGSYCADLGGGVSLVRGTNQFQAFTDATRSIMLLAGDFNTLGVAIRPTGGPGSVSGRYHLVSTAQLDRATSALVTWVGELTFESGCLLDPSSMATGVGLGPKLTFRPDGTTCFVAEAGKWRLSTTVDDESGVPSLMSWRGAIGPNGDVILLTRDDEELRYGTILLMRERPLATRAEMTGTWMFVSQRGGIANASQTESTVSRESGWLFLGETFRTLLGAIQGEGDASFEGDWWFAGAAGRYAQRAAFGSTLLHHGGFIAPDANFFFAWVAQPPEQTPGNPQELRPEPSEGSLFVAVRLEPFVRTAPAP